MLAPEYIIGFQTFFLALLFVSMAFRMKGNYLVHGLTMVVSLVVGWIAVAMTIPSFLDSSYTATLTKSPLSSGVVGMHIFFGLATLAFGTWLVALWRPRATDFATKTKGIWPSLVILWVSTYLIGMLVFVAVHTSLLG